MSRQIPLNDDTGSELVRALLRELNNLKADFDALKAGADNAADFAAFKTASQGLTIASSALDVAAVPGRPKSYKP